MHRLMVEENTKRKADGQALLTDLPKPCNYFDLIGGTSTGGRVAVLISSVTIVSLIWFPCFESYFKFVQESQADKWYGFMTLLLCD